MSSHFQTTVGFTSIAASSWLAGSIASISIISVPALISAANDSSTSPVLATRLWRIIYERGKASMPIVAATAAIGYGTLAYNRYSTQRPWLPFAFSSFMAVAIVPFTVVTMSSTNSSLIQISESKTAPGTAEGVVALLARWGSLNLTRSLLPFVGALTAIWYI
ncbi:hypothetical protein BKA67DRAFT_656596 [Truncatella angustata]|uniref:DUF1772-domain-containing protein n=1 Tax=Truncatella angustata TaxID=152316 RepID=A0A9P8UUD8_9PEZI|nr:uncharacterized protein BKA67DRAFT_656596 [Truncatella angustata]KAH6658403.1 hypothetical protein BKA67DRAFT_656596 [Truncatella angustata]